MPSIRGRRPHDRSTGAAGAPKRGPRFASARVVIVALAATCTVLSLPRRAEACTYLPDTPWQVDAARAAIDTQAPSAPDVQGAGARRGKGSLCDADGRCLVSSCGDWGNVFVQVLPAATASSTERVGYRLRRVDGFVPPGFDAVLQETRDGESSLLWRGPFDDVVAFDATFELIAIDRAGNESEASEPFEIAFDGCTRSPADSDDCLEEQVPPGTVISSEEAVVLGSNGTRGCSVAGSGLGHRSGGALSLLSCGVAGLVLARRRSRTSHPSRRAG